MMADTVLKWWRRTLIAVTALGAALASFVFLRELALHVGWPHWAAILLPLSVDALAAAALTEYRLTGSRTAVAVAVLAIVGSATGNAYSHLYTTGLLVPGWVAVTAVGAVPAVTVGLVVHLFTARRATWKPSETETGAGAGSSVSASGSATSTNPPTPVSTGTTGAAPAPASTGTNGTTGTKPRTGSTSSTGNKTSLRKRSDTELISTVLAESWQNETLDSLTSLLSVSKTRAGRIREAARSQGLSPSRNGKPSNPELAVRL